MKRENVRFIHESTRDESHNRYLIVGEPSSPGCLHMQLIGMKLVGRQKAGIQCSDKRAVYMRPGCNQAGDNLARNEKKMLMA